MRNRREEQQVTSPFMTAAPEQLVEILKQVPNEEPVIIWGPPGIGKTDIVNQHAEAKGGRAISFRAAEIRPEDITGPPMPYEDGSSRFHPPRVLLELTKEWQAKLKAEHDALVAEGKDEGEYQMPGPVVLFLDELPNAHPDVQATLHSLVLDRTIGTENYHLLENVQVVAAGNRKEDSLHVHELSPPLGTRFLHVEITPNLEQWVKWARRNGVNPNVIAFIQQRESLFFDFDKKTFNRTFPCPRTWARLSRALGNVPNEDLRRLIADGIVGPGAAGEYCHFEQVARKAPSAEEIAKNPEKVDAMHEDPDIALVCVENMIHAARRKPEWVKAFIKYAKRMHEQYREMLFPVFLNIDNDMPEETITEVLTSDDIGDVMDTSDNLRRILKEGDEAVKTQQTRMF